MHSAITGEPWERHHHPVNRIKRTLNLSAEKQANPFDEMTGFESHQMGFSRFIEKKKRESDKRLLVAHYSNERSRKEYLRVLFHRPVSFNLYPNVRVRILSTGILNVYSGNPNTRPRSLVGVFINGKRLFFYRSSGKNSGHPGKWFPCAGIEMIPHSTRSLRIGNIRKITGHPQYGTAHSFPHWVDVVSDAIAKAVTHGRIKLWDQTTPSDCQRFQETLNFFPPMERSVPRSGLPSLPDLS
ncbi:MAG: hypothetical protein V1776_00410 [Candidatus Diapherotrites archaeon]